MAGLSGLMVGEAEMLLVQDPMGVNVRRRGSAGRQLQKGQEQKQEDVVMTARDDAI